jgi:hypothetical protein
MPLDAAAQLLTSVILLMQAVSANPGLPQSVHDQTQALIQSTITETTRAIANPRPVSAGTPTCTITSDKPNYAFGEIILFNWTSTNATSFEFLPDTWRRDDAKDLGLLGPNGVWHRAATVRGYPFVTMKVVGSAGESTTCSKMVEVY